MHAAGLGDFSGPILIVFGLVSIMAAATFILKQTEYKRMLAYSSIENMGIIAFGTGIGGLGAYGAMICLIHHSLIKSSLFLTSGNILLGYGSRLIAGPATWSVACPKPLWPFSAALPAFPDFRPLAFLSANC
jgi:hydrogenase-4 component F